MKTFNNCPYQERNLCKFVTINKNKLMQFTESHDEDVKMGYY